VRRLPSPSLFSQYSRLGGAKHAEKGSEEEEEISQKKVSYDLCSKTEI